MTGMLLGEDVLLELDRQGGVTWIGTGAATLCQVCQSPEKHVLWKLKQPGVFELFTECSCSLTEVGSALERAAFPDRSPSLPMVGVNGAKAEGPFVVSSFMSSVPPNNGEPRQIDMEACYGITGKVLATLEPHTESASAALLASFHTSIGNLIGRSPHFWIEGARHGTNLFSVLVGVSSSGRKGTATNRIEEIVSSIDCNWTKNIVRGLSSGEGLTHAVRDARIEQVPVKKSGRFTGEHDEVTVDLGVSDKRCMVREEEFASVLRVMGREGNTLSAVVRNAWDNKQLGALTKSNRERATDPHISILGHITEIELKRHLTETESGNGFANRFLWFCTHRSKVLPRGGGRPDLLHVINELCGVCEFAREVEEVTFDEDAGKVWDVIYGPLSDRFPGLLGSITSRAEAQVLRMSVLYAVLDAERVIRVPHLLASLAVWDFCEKSAAYLFGLASGDDYADVIEEALRETESLTRTEIRDKFGRNAPPGRIPKAMAFLKNSGRADFRLVETGGRPLELWFALPYDKNDKTTKVPGGHLQRARAAVSTLRIE